MSFTLGIPELAVIVLPSLVWLVPGLFYVLTVAKALRRCSPRNRTLSPRHAWLLMIPLFNLIWHFFIVNGLTESLQGELRRRNIKVADPQLGRPLGLLTCGLFAAGILPFIGVIFWLVAFLCWLVYWIKIAGYSAQLERRYRPGVIVH